MYKTVAGQSSTIFYRTEGEGYPVVLLHGFAEDGHIWNQQVDDLKKECRLIIPDLPGSGRSEPMDKGPESPVPGMDDYAEVIKTILDEEKITRCVMIGHSMGGYIALAFAEKYPGFLSALGLFHSTAYADSEEKKAARKKSIAFIGKHGAAEFIRQSTPNLFSPFFREHHAEEIRNLIERYDNFNPKSLVSYYEAMMLRPDRTPVLQTFKGPILFIIGEQDSAVPPEHSLQQSHIPELSIIHILENTAHMGMLEATAQANTILLSFIKAG